MTEWTFWVAPGVEPGQDARVALEAARARMPAGQLFAAVVPGDEVWPRILDKEDAIAAAGVGLVALRAIEPGVLLVRGEPPTSFAETAKLLTGVRGYLVPEASGRRNDRAPRVQRLRLLAAPWWSRDERLWQLFQLARGGAPSRRASRA